MSRFLQALQCQNKGRPPIWLMRQAGRYMPSYQALRAKHPLLDMFRNKDLIVEVTKMPIDQLGVDAAILFSDILIVFDALGVDYDFKPGVGPVVMTSPSALRDKTRRSAEEAYPQIASAIKELKSELKVPLIGFAGAPFTVASYLVEGGSSRDLAKTKKWLYEDPKGFEKLLEKITEATIEYLNLQIDSGVDAIQIFDSWAGMLTPDAFASFASKPVARLVEAVTKKNIPIILFAKNTTAFSKLNPSGLSVDWSFDLSTLRQNLPTNMALQGNLDPCVLLGTKESIKQEASKLLKKMKDEPGYIFNLGHGVLPQIPLDHVKYLVELVKTC